MSVFIPILDPAETGYNKKVAFDFVKQWRGNGIFPPLLFDSNDPDFDQDELYDYLQKIKTWVPTNPPTPLSTTPINPPIEQPQQSQVIGSLIDPFF